MALDNTREGVALKLLEYIAWAEHRPLDLAKKPSRTLKKDWILKTFAQCLQTVGDEGTVRTSRRRRSGRR